MKKTYYPKSITMYLTIIILLFFLLVAIYIIVIFLQDIIQIAKFKDWLAFISSMIATVYIGYVILRVVRRKIVLNKDRVYVSDDIGNKDIKLQYGLNLSLAQIEEVRLDINSNNSLNKKIRWVVTPMPNIVFKLSNSKEARINLYYYSKKQVIEIIDCIIQNKQLIERDFTNKSGQDLVRGLKTKSY